MTDKNIYDLKLHEKIYINNYTILKVHGGWIYSLFEGDKYYEDATYKASVFVPYNEFLKGTNTK